MLNNELYKGNTKPVTGKIPEATEPAVDNAIKIDATAKPAAGRYPSTDNTMKIDQAKHRAEEGEYAGDSAMNHSKAGQTADAVKSAGDTAVKNDVTVKPVSAEKPETIKPVGDGSVRDRIEAAWDTQQPDAINPAPEKSEIVMPTAKQAAGHNPATYPDVKPIIK